MGNDLLGKRVAVLGAGKMGGILLEALLKNGLLSTQLTAATVPTSLIERGLPENVPVVRAMPNTPCSVGTGMTVVCKGKYADVTHVALTCKIFDVVGRTLVL